MHTKKWEGLERIIQEQHDNITGIVIAKNNEKVYEQYFKGYTENDTVHIASVTKSIVSILMGIAIDKGYIESVDKKVLDFFPEYITKRGEKTIQNITLKHLLTMTAPYKYKSEPYTKVYSSEDWTQTVLDLMGGKKEMGMFNYSTVGTHLLASVLVVATGQSVLQFATENLLEPLEIKTPESKKLPNKEAYLAFLKDKYVSGWVVDSKGVNTAGFGLTLTPRDMVKIGQLYLDQGRWKGEQIVSQKWIKESTHPHTKWGQLPYGYLWWLVEGGCESSYAALGDGGNVIYISGEKELVIAIAASFKPRAKDRIELIQKHILPCV